MDVGRSNVANLDGYLSQISALPHQIRAALAINGVHSGVPVDDAPLDGHPSGTGRPKARVFNKHRKSLIVDFLVLSVLEEEKENLTVVDQILAHVVKVFPEVRESGRASLITKISRLKRDKGCIVEDDDLKGVGYRISEGGLKYLRDLETTYLTKDERAFIKSRLI